MNLQHPLQVENPLARTSRKVNSQNRRPASKQTSSTLISKTTKKTEQSEQSERKFITRDGPQKSLFEKCWNYFLIFVENLIVAIIRGVHILGICLVLFLTVMSFIKSS